jgi:hypothetical protein
MTKKAVSGSVILRFGSVDPDPYQNVMDPEHGLYELALSSHIINLSKYLVSTTAMTVMKPEVGFKIHL